MSGPESNIAMAQAARAKKNLDGLIRHEGVVMTKRAFVEKLVRNGATLETREVQKLKDMSPRNFNRATLREQAEHEKRVREAGTKTEYYMRLPGEQCKFSVSKTMWDYAASIMRI